MFKKVPGKLGFLQKIARVQTPLAISRSKVLIGGFALVTASVLANSHLHLYQRYASAQSNIRTHLDGQVDLVGGNPELVTVYLLYDSKVAT